MKEIAAFDKVDEKRSMKHSISAPLLCGIVELIHNGECVLLTREAEDHDGDALESVHIHNE